MKLLANLTIAAFGFSLSTAFAQSSFSQDTFNSSQFGTSDKLDSSAPDMEFNQRDINDPSEIGEPNLPQEQIEEDLNNDYEYGGSGMDYDPYNDTSPFLDGTERIDPGYDQQYQQRQEEFDYYDGYDGYDGYDEESVLEEPYNPMDSMDERGDF